MQFKSCQQMQGQLSVERMADVLEEKANEQGLQNDTPSLLPCGEKLMLIHKNGNGKCRKCVTIPSGYR